MAITAEGSRRAVDTVEGEITQISNGYNLTELGINPKDWLTTKLGDLASHVGSGKSKLVGTKNTFPVFGSTGIIGYSEESDYEGDAILVARVGANAGKLNIVTGQYGVTDNTIIIRIPATYNINYFYKSLEKQKLNRLVFGSGQPLITGSQLKNLSISIPSIGEQNAIASTLNDIDSLITSLEQLIAKNRNINQATMQQLLTGKKRLPGFSGDWITKKLIDIGVFSKGRGIKKNEVVSEGIPCIRYGEIYTHHNDIVKKIYSFITKDIAKESQRLRIGDLLFTGSGETPEDIGKCVAFLSREETYAGGDIVILSPSAQDSRFLGYLMNHPSISYQKMRMAQGDAIVHISARNLAQIKLHLPPIKEQIAIANILSDMDTEISALEQQLDKTRNIKQGMMQELLTGRVRLI